MQWKKEGREQKVPWRQELTLSWGVLYCLQQEWSRMRGGNQYLANKNIWRCRGWLMITNYQNNQYAHGCCSWINHKPIPRQGNKSGLLFPLHQSLKGSSRRPGGPRSHLQETPALTSLFMNMHHNQHHTDIKCHSWCFHLAVINGCAVAARSRSREVIRLWRRRRSILHRRGAPLLSERRHKNDKCG